jgi:hypothetical protein
VSGRFLVDDHLLLDVLLGDEPGLLRRADALATTGLWYHRLCRALSDDAVVGSLSRRLGGADPGLAADVVGAVSTLPDEVDLVSLRSLAWPMAQLLHTGARLNRMSLEALAAARHLGATICLADVDGNGPLRVAADQFGVSVRTVAR